VLSTLHSRTLHSNTLFILALSAFSYSLHSLYSHTVLSSCTLLPPLDSELSHSLYSRLCTPCDLDSLCSAFSHSLYPAFLHSLCFRICALVSVLSIVLESRVLRVREYTDCEGTESRMQSRECNARAQRMTRALCVPLLQVLQVQDSRASIRQLGEHTVASVHTTSARTIPVHDCLTALIPQYTAPCPLPCAAGAHHCSSAQLLAHSDELLE
jgi:hypothetical protein